MNRNLAVAASAIALAAGLGAAACAATAPTGSLSPDQLATIEAADRLIATELSPDEAALIVNAHGSVVSACMRDLGWDFAVDPATAEIAGGGPRTLSQLERWTFSNTAMAETDGYGLEDYLRELAAFYARVEAGSGEGSMPDIDSMSPEEGEQYWLDFAGTDQERVEIVERDGSMASIAGGGCMGEAERAVYGDIEQKLRLQDARTTAESEIWGAALANQAVTSTLATWKGCMAQQGLQFGDPAEAFDAALTAAQAGDHAQERLVATADARCKAQSGLGLAIETAFLAATNAVIGELEDDLVALQQFEQEALARAKDILRTGG